MLRSILSSFSFEIGLFFGLIGIGAITAGFVATEIEPYRVWLGAGGISSIAVSVLFFVWSYRVEGYKAK